MNMREDAVEIDWTDDGIRVTSAWDVYIAKTANEQDDLRRALIDVTHPKATPKQVARLAGVNIRTLYSFTAGTHVLTRRNYAALSDVVRRLQAGGGA